MIHLNVSGTEYRTPALIHDVMHAFERSRPIEATDADGNRVFLNPAQIAVIRVVDDDDED